MSKEILAPMPGTIINILVNEGDEILEYQEVVILEATKRETAIPSPDAGVVKEIKVTADDKVSTNQMLIIIDPKTSLISYIDVLPKPEASVVLKKSIANSA